MKSRQPVPVPWARYSTSPRLFINFARGLNENTTPDVEECGVGYNFDLAVGQTSFNPRKAFDLAGTAPAVSGVTANTATGLMQLVKRDTTQTTLSVHGTAVFLWDGASTFTNKGTVTAPALMRDTYWSLGEYLVITDINLNNAVQMWDATTFQALPTGLANVLKAKYALVYLNRVWLFNITYNNVAYPHMVLASYFQNPQSYSTSIQGGPTTVGGGTFSTGLEAFYLLAPDMRPINGAVVFQNTLIISTKEGRLWQLNGSSSLDFRFTDFFDNEPAVGNECLTNVGNDVAFVARGGQINSLVATQNFGAVKPYSLSKWVPTSTKNITPTQIIYDVVNQKILFFVGDKILVLFKDIMLTPGAESQKSPWSVYKTQASFSFNTSTVKYMYAPGTTNYSVFLGDSSGNLYNLNGAGLRDAGSYDISAYRRTRHIGTEILPSWPWVDENITGRLRYRRLTPVEATITLEWDDEYNNAQTTVKLKGPPVTDTAPYWGDTIYWGDTNYWNDGFQFTGGTGEITLDPGGKGPGFYMSVSVTTNSTFEIDAIEWD